MNIQVLKAAAGWRWIEQGFALVWANPGLWLVYTLLGLGLVALFSALGGFFPGFFFFFLLFIPHFMAGFMHMAKAVEEGERNVSLDFLFLGFGRNFGFGHLLLLGFFLALALTASLAVFVGVVLLLVGSMFGVASLVNFGGMIEAVEGLLTLGALSVTVLLAIIVIFAFVLWIFGLFAFFLWFAPALISFRGCTATEALGLSVRAVGRNLAPVFIYLVLMLVCSMLLGAVTFGLGYLALIPLMMASAYVSYREIFSPVS